MSRRPPNSSPPPAAATTHATRMVCFLRPGEYAQRFERQLVREQIVVLRARHAMHAYWVALTTRPDAIITDLPVAQLDRNYLIQRLATHRQSLQMPVLVLATSTRDELFQGLNIPANVHVLNITTPTKMAKQAVQFVQGSADALTQSWHERIWRADGTEPMKRPKHKAGRRHAAPHDSGMPVGAAAVPRRRASGAPWGTLAATDNPSLKSGLIVPRRATPAPPGEAWPER